MARRHVVISGTGRTGTTFLVLLLTHLGLDTGFKPGEAEARIDKVGRAGLEHDPRTEDAPYVVKTPWFCDFAHAVVDRADIVIEHVFIPVRDLHAAAESRRHVFETNALNARDPKKIVAGGLWHTHSSEPGRQEDVLLRQIYKLLLALSGTTIPVTLMRYPRLASDSAYLFEKLMPVLGGITYEAFEAAFQKTVRPDLVNSYNSEDR
jgi:hypothetical protein